MHAALGFLLILTVHRCYPAGVPRCLQGNFIRHQIRQHFQTLIFIWIFAILINLPLFSITKYDRNGTHINENSSNQTEIIYEPTCETEATEIWSRTYLILLLVSTYFITGIFLIVIYGQVIRIILVSKKYRSHANTMTSTAHPSRFLSANFLPNPDQSRSNAGRSSTSSTTTHTTNRRQQQQLNSTSLLAMSSLIVPSQGRTTKNRRNSHSTQHLQVIIMLFIVILLYILLLLPYRLLNLLYIVHNQLFQQNFMNEILFQCLVNTVRLLVFINCALQPITYIIISSRLRQTVIKFLQSSWEKCSCRCRCAFNYHPSPIHTTGTAAACPNESRAIQAYLSQKYPSSHRSQPMLATSASKQRLVVYREHHLTDYRTGGNNRTPYTVTFNNTLRK